MSVSPRPLLFLIVSVPPENVKADIDKPTGIQYNACAFFEVSFFAVKWFRAKPFAEEMSSLQGGKMEGETPMEQEEKPVNDQEDAQCQESSAMAKEDEAEDTVREEEKTLEETKILESQEETLAGMENPDDMEPVHNPKEGLMDWIREGIMRMLKF